MSGKFIRLSICTAVSVLVILPTYAADFAYQARLKHEAEESSVRLEGVCRDAWQYDNLRPTIQRAIAPIITPIHWPDLPVVHLSPGSPDYRKTVGDMMYWYWLYYSQQQRLANIAAELKASSPQLRGRAGGEQLGRAGNRG